MPLPADVWTACRPKDPPLSPPAPSHAAAPLSAPAPAPHAPAGQQQTQPLARPSALGQMQPLQLERVVPPRRAATAAAGATAPPVACAPRASVGRDSGEPGGVGSERSAISQETHASTGCAGAGAGLDDGGDGGGMGFDPDFDTLCVEALERLERQHGW
jgi:hypothetical protein